MKPVRFLRIVLALLLLSAQQAAFAHKIWHLGEADSQPAQKQLCGQHGALDNVAGSIDCALPVIPGGEPAGFLFLSPALPSAAVPARAPSCRGPPALS